MKITILCVGKIKEKYLQMGIAEYTKRLGKYGKLEILEVPDEKTPEAEAKPVTEPAADDKSAETAPETGVKSDVKAEPKSDA